MQPQPPLTLVEIPETGRLYRHYKGDYYRIVSLSRDSEEKDRGVEMWLVTYVSLGRGHTWTQRLVRFIEPVIWPDGRLRQRFMPVPWLPRDFEERAP